MSTNKIFNINRFSRLLKREYRLNVKRNLLLIGAMYSLFTIISLLVLKFGEVESPNAEIPFKDFHFLTFTITLFVGGIFITSLSFIELRNKLKAHFYLILPGSTFEKFLVNLVTTLFGYVVFMIIFYLIYSRLYNLTASFLCNVEIPPLNLTDKNFFLVINLYLCVHSIFYLGSVIFRKYPIIFTPIAVLVIAIIYSLISQLTTKVLFAGVNLDEQISSIEVGIIFEQLKTTIKLVAFYLLPLILWYITYLKLKEKEY